MVAAPEPQLRLLARRRACAERHQALRRGLLTGGQGQHVGGEPVVVGQVEVGAGRDERLDGVEVAVRGGVVQRGRAGVVAVLHVDAPGQQVVEEAIRTDGGRLHDGVGPLAPGVRRLRPGHLDHRHTGGPDALDDGPGDRGVVPADHDAPAGGVAARHDRLRVVERHQPRPAPCLEDEDRTVAVGVEVDVARIERRWRHPCGLSGHAPRVGGPTASRGVHAAMPPASITLRRLRRR